MVHKPLALFCWDFFRIRWVEGLFVSLCNTLVTSARFCWLGQLEAFCVPFYLHFLSTTGMFWLLGLSVGLLICI